MRWVVFIGLIPILGSVEPTMQWVDDALATSDRVAVLVAADAFASDPSWALPAAKASLEAVQKSLVLGADIPLRFQRVLRGEQVTHDGVDNAITAQAARVAGQGLLLVYWIGHGGSDAKGQSVLFTHFTEAVDGRFTKSLPRNDLSAMTDRARASVRARGGDLQVVFVGEVCRIPVGAPPPTGSVAPSQDWEVYGTALGKYTSIPNAGVAPFSASWSESLIAIAKLGRPSDLQTVFLDVAERTRRTSNGTQSPALVPPPGAQPPAIVRPARMHVRLAVSDSLAKAPVAGAKIEFSDGQKLEPGKVADLPIGAMKATVCAEGYAPTTVTIDSSFDRSGCVLELPAHPAVAVIRGSFSGSNQPVAVVGVSGGMRADCHRVETRTDNHGAFVLVIPAVTSGLTVRIAGREIPLPSDPARWPIGEYLPGVAAPVCDLGMIAPAADGRVVKSPATSVAPVAVPDVPLLKETAVPTTTAQTVRSEPPSRFEPISADNANRWPAFARTNERPVVVNNVIDLSELGTPNGLPPTRWLVGTRLGSVLDARMAGTPRGIAPLAPGGGPPRLGTVIDLSARGTARGIMPLSPVDPVMRKKQILDLSTSGTAAGLAPLAPVYTVERTETVVDLADAGTPAGRNPGPSPVLGERTETVIDLADAGHPAEQPFTIPEELRLAMEKAKQ